MKKLFSLSLASTILFSFSKVYAQQSMGPLEMICTTQTVLHADKKVTPTEKKLFKQTTNLPSQTIDEIVSQSCSIPLEFLLEEVSHKDRDSKVKLLAYVSALMHYDGQIQPQEKELAIQFLRWTINDSNAPQPDPTVLLTLSKTTALHLKRIKEEYFPLTFDQKREDIVNKLKMIVQAQISYEDSYGEYVSCKPYPEKPSVDLQAWDVEKSGGFRNILMDPPESARASYSVTTSKSGFTVKAISDLDGDGVYATYIATKDEAPTRTTPPTVY